MNEIPRPLPPTDSGESPSSGRFRPFSRAAAKEKDRYPRLCWRISIVLVGAAMPVLGVIFSTVPGAVERFYTNGIGLWIARALASISRWIPFSLAETILVVLVAWLSGGAVVAMVHVARRKRRFVNAFACGALKFATVAGVLLLVFYVAWAFNFARNDLVTRMRWQDFAKEGYVGDDTDELARLCEAIVDRTNEEYVLAFGTEDLGKPSTPPEPFADIDDTINTAYGTVAKRLKLHPSFAISRGPAKPILLSFVMDNLLTLGFYSPWTGEANYNRNTPDCQKPQVVAHEKAHQRGITNEDEANFFGFLVCISSDDPYIRYSGHLFAQRQLLGELIRKDEPRGKVILERRYKGVQQDSDAIRRYGEAHRGRVSNVSRIVNNTYLRANRVKGGVQSYAMSSRLIVIYSRVNGGGFDTLSS